jgi:tripartite ATP-independent transporter DctP family solute receptor
VKRRLALFLVILLSLSFMLTGCGDSGEDTAGPTPENPIVIRLAHVLAEDHASHITLVNTFKKDVEEKSEGRIKVEVYPNAQLGSDRQAIEAVSLGSLEMAAVGGAVLSGFVEDFMVLDLPFLFPTREAAHKALDGELGAALNEALQTQGIINLGTGEGGFRNITNSVRPIIKPEDLKGIKIRTMENPIHMATFKAYGANPTPMAFGELFTALQQKTVDAQENPISIIYTAKFNEVQKYLTLSGHVYGTVPLIINKDFYEGLPEDLQAIISDAAVHWVEVHRETANEQDTKYVSDLEAAGMEITKLTPEQKQAFIDAAQPVYDDFIKQYGEKGQKLIELARAAAN